ncbi:MAG: hypothetical protein ABH845_05635, partial [Candidatus Omnitrophota bacterium]
ENVDKKDYPFYNNRVMTKIFSFKGALLFSSALHLVAFLGSGRFGPMLPSNPLDSTPKTLEVVYSIPTFMERVSLTKSFAKEETPSPLNSVKVEEKPAEDNAPTSEKFQTPPVAQHPEPPIAASGKVSPEEQFITGLNLTYEEKPLYLAYYRTIREKIRTLVRRYYTQELREGQVFLTFILFANGKLKEVKAAEVYASQDRRLEGIALRSVIDASPFPPFPEGLKRSYVPFRVMITFVGYPETDTGDSSHAKSRSES